MLPSTTSRVERNTAASVNREIQQRTEENIAYFAENPHKIELRLHELEQEWDIERTLEANASTLNLVGITLAAAGYRRWLILPAAVSGFLLQHALQGWCPPIVILRKRGIRTSSEIDLERYALKALRGDFGGLEDTTALSTEERVRKVLVALGNKTTF
ncbi:DUF2892 domain-containing protein [Halomonas sp. ZH2S]|uniref:DUF2892 domain-containing protein n=1 Tax=Vreelandella zhuhanensis TaxID=2684210 RepID=A0A7X3GY03_9GAMM|nr:DUF2892 domain-containing protein [Halomonas zhuhanensis]MWJ26973.1 DUF2892 domain-containing protein [Halomonas zhuhanensis]